MGLSTSKIVVLSNLLVNSRSPLSAASFMFSNPSSDLIFSNISSLLNSIILFIKNFLFYQFHYSISYDQIHNYQLINLLLEVLNP